MTPTPLGEVCVSLGLLTAAQVDAVLARLSEGERGRFGEVAVEMGLLDETGLARALARQFDANTLTDEQVARLTVPPAVLDLLPPNLMRDRLVVPVLLDPESKALSLLVADPTDLPSLRAAQRFVRAPTARLFVAARASVRALVERLLPEGGAAAEPVTVGALSSDLPTAAVLETDPDRLEALRRLEAVEEGRAELVADPEQITALVEAGLVDRVFVRRALQPIVAPYRAAWQRTRPGLQINVVEGFGPGFRPAIPYESVRRFFQDLVEFLLMAGESRHMEVRDQARQAVTLCREVADELRLPPEQRDAVVLASLFADLGSFSLLSGLGWEHTVGGPVRFFGLPLTLLMQLDCPYDVAGIFRGLERRFLRRGEPGPDLATEVVFTCRRVAGRRIGPDRPLEAVLNDGETSHHELVVDALARVLRRRAIHQALAAEGHPPRPILVAETDPAVLTAVEMHLNAAHYEVISTNYGEAALDEIRRQRPAIALVSLHLPGLDAPALLGKLAQDPALAQIPALVLTDPDEIPAAERVVGSRGVLTRPVNIPTLLAQVRAAVRASRGDAAPTAVEGSLADITVVVLLRTLITAGQTASVTLLGTGEDASVHVGSGRLRAASFAEHTGMRALSRVVTQDRGRFSIRFGERPAHADLDGDPDRLLGEALATGLGSG